MDGGTTDAMKTAVLLVLFTQLMCDAVNRRKGATPTHRVPLSTVAVCELAVAMFHGEPSHAPIPITVDVPEGIGSARSHVLLLFEWIVAALNAQAFAANKQLFMPLFARVVLANMQFADTALVDDSHDIPAGMRSMIATIINTVKTSPCTDEQRKQLRHLIAGARRALEPACSEAELGLLRDVREYFEQSVPSLSWDSPGTS
jgi:hypothetical protein